MYPSHRFQFHGILKHDFVADVPFFLVSIASNSHFTLRPLGDWETCKDEGHEVCHSVHSISNLKVCSNTLPDELDKIPECYTYFF